VPVSTRIWFVRFGQIPVGEVQTGPHELCPKVVLDDPRIWVDKAMDRAWSRKRLVRIEACRNPAPLLATSDEVFMGHMARQEGREEQARVNAKFTSTLVIAAAIIVTVRLAREDISLPSPRLLQSVGQSISGARTILKEVLRRYPGA